jgi:predicted DNA-binding transcriptional regulator AlpA
MTQPHTPLPADLIGTAEIAQMLQLNREHVVSRVIKRPDFPAPALRLSRKTVRWSRAVIELWLARVTVRGGM